MPNKLVITAGSWEAKKVPSTFVVTAGGVALAAVDPAKQIYDIPAGTTDVQVAATPTVKEYWPTTISLVVASNGSISPKAASSAWVTVAAATGATSGVTQATIKMSRFKEVTARVFGLLKTMPAPRPRTAPDAPELQGTYGTWPPADWDVKPAPKTHYLDVATPVAAGAMLEMARQPGPGRPKGLPKTGGRKKGTANKLLREEQIKEAARGGIMPLEYMLATLRNPDNTHEMRMEAAGKAAPYTHARLEPVDPNQRPVNPYANKTTQEINAIFVAELAKRGFKLVPIDAEIVEPSAGVAPPQLQRPRGNGSGGKEPQEPPAGIAPPRGSKGSGGSQH